MPRCGTIFLRLIGCSSGGEAWSRGADCNRRRLNGRGHAGTLKTPVLGLADSATSGLSAGVDG